MSKSGTASSNLNGVVMNLALKDLERENRLPGGYLVSLMNADADWDFIVKLSLVLEALVTRAILQEAGPVLSYEQVSMVSQSNRIRKAMQLGLIDKAERKMLEAIAEIRNAFVHRIENLTRPLSAYFQELTPERRKKIATSILSAGIPGELDKLKDKVAIEEFAADFRQTVMHALFPTLLNLGYSYEIKQKERKYAEWRADQERRLGRPLPARTEIYLTDRLMIMELVAAEALKQ
jgi:hypothetical protein